MKGIIANFETQLVIALKIVTAQAINNAYALLASHSTNGYKFGNIPAAQRSEFVELIRRKLRDGTAHRSTASVLKSFRIVKEHSPTNQECSLDERIKVAQDFSKIEVHIRSGLRNETT